MQQVVENKGAKPWDILPDEDMAWFKRFEKYRLMQPEDRNLKVLYMSERERRKRLGTLAQLPAYRTYLQIAKKYDWPGRAREYDKAEVEKDRATSELLRTEESRSAEEERALQRQQRRQIMGILFNKLLAGVNSNNFDLTNAKPGELLQFMRLYLKENREEYDNTPARYRKFQFDTLTDQELYELIQEQLTLNPGRA